MRLPRRTKVLLAMTMMWILRLRLRMTMPCLFLGGRLPRRLRLLAKTMPCLSLGGRLPRRFAPRNDNDVDSSPTAPRKDNVVLVLRWKIAASPTAPRKDNVGLVLKWKIATSRLAPLLAMTEERANREKNFVLQYFRFGANAKAIRNFLKEK